MTTRDQLIRARVGILAMAAELKNIAKACKVAGVSRSQFYAMKKAYEIQGKEGLAPRVRRKPAMPNRTPAPLEEQILIHTHKHPLFSYVRLAGKIKSEGREVTSTMVRYVWRRHGLSTRSARLEWAKLLNSSVSIRSISVSNHPPLRISTKDANGKCYPDASSGVDWAYWSDRVRESLSK